LVSQKKAFGNMRKITMSKVYQLIMKIILKLKKMKI